MKSAEEEITRPKPQNTLCGGFLQEVQRNQYMAHAENVVKVKAASSTTQRLHEPFLAEVQCFAS